MATQRRIFIAGSTGAVGRTVLRLADAAGDDVVPHVRPKTAAAKVGQVHPKAAVLELSQLEELSATLQGRTTVLQLIGTMRKRFASGDTYESSDIGTTQQLVDAAKRAGTIDHFVLLSSVGAGKPMGAYLAAKARAESIVRESGIPYTIFRPSAFVGEGHREIPLMGALTKLVGADRYRPIRVEELAAAILSVARDRSNVGEVLEGASLWRVVDAAGASSR